jgi:hypothetical protein
MIKQRYFFICTLGKNPNQSLSFNTFEFITTYGHPTIKRCLELSHEKFPNQRDLILLSISEIKELDWPTFVSEK